MQKHNHKKAAVFHNPYIARLKSKPYECFENEKCFLFLKFNRTKLLAATDTKTNSPSVFEREAEE